MSQSSKALSLLNTLHAENLLEGQPILATLRSIPDRMFYKSKSFTDYFDSLQGEVLSVGALKLRGDVNMVTASSYLVELATGYEQVLDGLNRTTIDAQALLGQCKTVYARVTTLKGPFLVYWSICAREAMTGQGAWDKLTASDIKCLAAEEFTAVLGEADQILAALIEGLTLTMENLKSMRKLAADKYAIGKDQVNAALSEGDQKDMGIPDHKPHLHQPTSQAVTLQGMFGDRFKAPVEEDVPPVFEDRLEALPPVNGNTAYQHMPAFCSLQTENNSDLDPIDPESVEEKELEEGEEGIPGEEGEETTGMALDSNEEESDEEEPEEEEPLGLFSNRESDEIRIPLAEEPMMDDDVPPPLPPVVEGPKAKHRRRRRDPATGELLPLEGEGVQMAIPFDGPADDSPTQASPQPEELPQVATPQVEARRISLPFTLNDPFLGKVTLGAQPAPEEEDDLPPMDVAPHVIRVTGEEDEDVPPSIVATPVATPVATEENSDDDFAIPVMDKAPNLVDKVPNPVAATPAPVENPPKAIAPIVKPKPASTPASVPVAIGASRKLGGLSGLFKPRTEATSPVDSDTQEATPAMTSALPQIPEENTSEFM